jgi:glycosyltransferase involved in cell wall biosynthesis/FMN phosphatase YigB (HAD superfamily)
MQGGKTTGMNTESKTSCSVYGRVAVITRTRNRPSLLDRACRSVLDQTFRDWIHVIVNDGGSVAAVESVVACYRARYAGRVLVVHHAESMGMQSASNAGIAACDSEFIVIHDDDDSWMPKFLEACVYCLDGHGPASETQGVVTQSQWIIERMRPDGGVEEVRRTPYFPFANLGLFNLSGENAFPPIAFVFRRAAYAALGPFDPTYNEIGDWEFNLRFLARYEIAVLGEPLALYHWRSAAAQGDYGNSVVEGVTSHYFNTARLMNDRLRSDLRGAGGGLGLAMGMARRTAEQRHTLEELTRRMEELRALSVRMMERTNHLECLLADFDRLWRLKCRVLDVLDYTRRRIAARRAGRRPPPPPAPARPADPDLTGVEVVSFDIFDTALRRLVRLPTDVFLAMAPDVRRIAPDAAVAFLEIRMRAERVARERGRAFGFGDCTLAEIYAELGAICGLTDEQAAALMAVELARETETLFADPAALRLYRAVRASGRRALFVSDMYLPADFLRETLIRNGFEEPEVVVSSETRKTKYDGALFPVLVERAGVAPERILHIGDHAHSDVCQPAAHGLRAHLWTAPGAPIYADQTLVPGARWGWLSSLFAGLARRRARREEAADDVWAKLGYELVGPMYLAYVLWVLKTARDDGVQRLFFLSRDGYHLVDIARQALARAGATMEIEYLYASRRMMNVPGLAHEMTDEALTFLTTPNPGMRVRDFPERIGLAPADYEDALRQAGYAQPDEVITTPFGVFQDPAHVARMRGFFASIWPRVQRLAEAERAQVQAYLRDMKFEPATSALVDIGWQCSSARALQRLLADGAGAPEPAIRGYYFGTWTFAEAAIQAGAKVRGWFFHLRAPERRADLVAECVELIESFFTAPHPSVLGVQRTKDGWTPTHGDWECDEAHRAGIERAVEAAHALVADALPHLPAMEDWDESPDYLETVLTRVLRHPTADEARAMGGIRLRNSFGGRGPLRAIAEVPGDAVRCFSRPRLQAAYALSYWKKGFRAQLSPRDQAKLS